MAIAKKLTKLGVKNLKPPEAGRSHHPDAVVPGLALRVTPKGRKSWSLLYRRLDDTTHKLRRYTLGSYPRIQLKKARELAREKLLEIDNGIDPAREKKLKRLAPRATTFEDVAALFVAEHVSQKRARTQEEMRRPIEKILVPRWGDMPVKEITRGDIKSLIAAIAKDHPIKGNRTLALIKTLFNFAVDGEYISAPSPAAGIKPPAAEVARERVLADDEVARIWAACDQAGYPFGPAIQILLLTGARRNEVATMKWTDIADDVWTVPREKTKADRWHEIPLAPLATEILDSIPHRGESHYVFTVTGRTPISGWPRAKKRLGGMAGLDDWRLHDLRRTCGTNMARLGVPQFTISRVLNHAEGGVTQVYVRASHLPEKRAALEVWARKLETIIRPQADKVVELRGP